MSLRWTEHQTAAMEHLDGDMLVMAGAGSGKTAVLAQRCVNLVTQDHDPCGVDDLLVVTFTDAATNEMRGRIATLLRSTAQTLARTHPQDAPRLLEQAALVDQAQISTLHSFCATTLRLWFHQCNLDPAFTILDEHESHLLFSQALQTVLDLWLTRTDAQADTFAQFFDVYSNSSVTALEKVIARVEQTWELTPDPHQWLQHAEEIAASNDAATMQWLFQAAQSAMQDLTDYLAPIVGRPPLPADPKGQMHNSIGILYEQLRGAITALNTPQEDAWNSVQQQLTSFQWPTIRFARNLTDDDAARHFKTTIYDELKKRLAVLNKTLFAAPLTTLLQWSQQIGTIVRALLKFHADVHAEFQTLKSAANQLSFADVERYLLEALQKPHSVVAAELQRRYRHVLVDEYQDINPVQQEILTKICRIQPPGSFFIVGDALQSIYGFRGGEPGLFLDRASTLRQSPCPPNRLVEMTENFRTLPNLLDAMNLVFQKVFAQLPADARLGQLPPLRQGRLAQPASDHHLLTGSPIELLVVVSQSAPAATASPADDTEPDNISDTDDDVAIEDMSNAQKEAVRLVDRIGQLISQNKLSSSVDQKPRPITYSDIVILLRSPRYQAQQFVRVFLENGIPAHSVLTSGYFAAPEVQEILALLEVLDNPFQDIPLAATLLGPLGRFSYDDLAAIRAEFPPSRELRFHQAVFRAMYHPVGHAASWSGDFADLPQRLQSFFQKLDGWRLAIRTLGVPEGLARIYQDSGLLIWSAGLPQGRQRVANLQMLYQRALEFSCFQHQGLSRFLAFLRDLQNQDIDLGTAPVAAAGDDALRIMSIHKSKGLEFPIVILAGLGSKFNNQDTQGDCLVHRQHGIGLRYKDPDTGQCWSPPQYQQIRTAIEHRGLAEEARLLYVAMTRARDKLILVGSVRERSGNPWRPTSPKPSVQCALDWIAPIFATSDTTLSDGSSAMKIFPQAATSAPRSDISTPPLAAAGQATTATLAQLLSDQSSPSATTAPATTVPQPADPEVQALITRLTSTYPWQPLTMLPAVTKVTELKSHLLSDEEESPAAELITPAAHPVALLPETNQSPAIQRGIATHRLLQLLNLAQPVDAAGIGRQISALVDRQLLSADDAALIDPVAVAWIFQTPIGLQIIAVTSAQGTADDPGSGRIHRELPFLWSMEPHLLASAPKNCASPGTNSADRVLVRGVIDLLLATPRELHLVDYKTDLASQIQVRTPMYTRQLRYYAQAVSAILGRPATHATLLFLSAQTVIPVSLHP